MNYYAARQRLSDQRFDFTCMNDGKTWPVGYCKVWRPLTAEDLSYVGSPEQIERMVKEHQAKFEPLKANYHADGHATAEEAQACYRKYLLDTQLRFSDKPNEEEQRRCAICSAWTQHIGWVDMKSWPLCVEHQTRESVEKLYPAVSQIVSSY